MLTNISSRNPCIDCQSGGRGVISSHPPEAGTLLPMITPIGD